LKRQTILLVEDQDELRRLFAELLTGEGFTIATAATGLEAIRQARAVVPDLILLDVVLPELDGFAVCERLRRDPAFTRTPIIMITGLTGQIPRCAGIESGATDFVTKPVSAQELVAKVRQALDQIPRAAVAA